MIPLRSVLQNYGWIMPRSLRLQEGKNLNNMFKKHLWKGLAKWHEK